MKIKDKKIDTVISIVIIFLFGLVGIKVIFSLLPSLPNYSNLDLTPSNPVVVNNNEMTNADKMKNKIQLLSPNAGETIQSPLTVSGEARGTWFFENSFPVVLKNSRGITLAISVASSSEDWMTENFIPFEAVLEFPEQTPGTVGRLILMKDNPSGDPARDEELWVPISF
jgi:hypothetical protein